MSMILIRFLFEIDTTTTRQSYIDTVLPELEVF